jgi:hypothetical protein
MARDNFRDPGYMQHTWRITMLLPSVREFIQECSLDEFISVRP